MKSQADRVLDLLRTGPKTSREILAEVPCIVHSRIAQLRDKRGCDIVCERVNGYGAGAFRYTLLAEPSGDEGHCAPGVVSDGSASNALLSEPEQSGESSLGRDTSSSSGSETSECILCGQRRLGYGLRCDDCKQKALDGSEATIVGEKTGDDLGNDEPGGTAASLPLSAGEQLRLVA